jgi:predicted dienelactone hydrolase
MTYAIPTLRAMCIEKSGIIALAKIVDSGIVDGVVRVLLQYISIKRANSDDDVSQRQYRAVEQLLRSCTARTIAAMHSTDHALIGAASKLPKPTSNPIISYSPLTLSPSDRRDIPLQLRITFPATTTTSALLPILLLSHGHGQSNYLSSLEGYAPLAEFYAAHGFVVVQPTHLSSRSLSLPLNGESIREIFLDSRVRDMVTILDELETIEASVPLLKGRLDKERVAVFGHSLGAATAAVLLGAVNTDPRDGTATKSPEARIQAGLIVGGLGAGGENLSENGKKTLPFYGMDFSSMAAPALVVWGDEDVSPHLSSRDASWHQDPFTLAPGPKSSFKVTGGKHGFGGISGWDAGETQDESPERLAAVQRVTLAYLKSQLYEGDVSWSEAIGALQGLERIGKVEEK